MPEKKPKKMSGHSLNPQEGLLALLRDKCPEIFTDGKVDVDKLKLTLGEKVETGKERYGLSWPGKAECFRVFQEPTTATLVPDREESKNFDETKNIFIEGDNLEALKILQKAYYGQVKMIYIDPPYNTGNDFIYSDNFRTAKREYLMEIGAIDEDGNVVNAGLYKQNTSDSGHFHSTWLNMMYPRLMLARQLLRQDGVIFVSIDDHEHHALRLMMDDAFGSENFLCSFVWEKRYGPPPDTKDIGYIHENILCYRRSENFQKNFLQPTAAQLARYKNPDNDQRGPWKAMDYTCRYTKDERPNLYYSIKNPHTGKDVWPKPTRVWAFSKEEHKKNEASNSLWWGVNGNAEVPAKKNFLDDVQKGRMPVSLLSHEEVGHTDEATKELRELISEIKFTPKPTRLIRRLLEIATNNQDHDIILDFFAGSGTTAHAVMALNAEDGGNRQCISIQLPEVCREGTEARKAGYKSIAQIARERIRRAGEKIKEESKHDVDIGFKAFRVQASNFKIWDPVFKGVEELEKQMDLFDDPLQPWGTDEGILYELMLKNGMNLTTPLEKVETKGGAYYRLKPSGAEKGSPVIILCIQKEVSEALAAQMIAEKPDKFMCIDRCFEHDEVLLTNTVLRMEQEGTEFSFV